MKSSINLIIVSLSLLALAACGGGGGDAPANTDPVFDTDLTAAPNSTDTVSAVTFSWAVSDADGDTLSCQLDINNDGTNEYTISDCANNTSQAHTFSVIGNYTAELTVSDGNGGSVSQTLI